MNYNKLISLNIPPYLALTGRVESWLKELKSADNQDEMTRLPVSCTVFSVEDSMEGENGIEASWVFTSHALRYAAGVALDLSKLRPKGSTNDKGLTASGVVSFAKFYSLINQELRRGGTYKNGACTLHLNLEHPDIEDYLNASSKELPWIKRAVYVDRESLASSSEELIELLARKVNNGSVWLAKKNWDENGVRLRSNVCLEVLLKHRGSCILSPVNLGYFDDIEAIPDAFTESMKILCTIQKNTGIGEDGHYLHPDVDRQVGLGIIGLANLLAIHDVKYKDFIVDLENIVGLSTRTSNNSVSYEIAKKINEGYIRAARVARINNMDRAFAIAPTASVSYRHTDADGYYTTPEISPPIAQTVDRDSDTFGVTTYEYHPNIETAKEVGWSLQWRLLNAWQKMMNNTELAHAISSNIWSTQTITPKWITDVFMPSKLQTTYYRVSVDQEALDKSEIVTPDSSEEKLRGVYFDPGAIVEVQDVYKEEEEILLNSALDDEKYCEACGG